MARIKEPVFCFCWKSFSRAPALLSALMQRRWKRPAGAPRCGGRKSKLVISAALLFLAAPAFSKAILDPVFNQGAGTDNFAEQVLPQPDGKILLCGCFGFYNGQWAPWIVRLNEDGTIDPTFQSTVGSWVRHMVLQPDGKIIIGGAFSSAGGLSRNLIARLNPDGTVDPTFDPGTGFQDKLVPPDPNPPYVFWMALQRDGKILVTGSFAKFNGQTVNGIARLNPDGSLDKSFKSGAGLNSWGRFVMVQPNNQIMLTGWFTDYNGFACSRMVRLNPDGTPDSAFHTDFGDKTAIYSVALLPDGKMIVSGHSKSDFGYFHREMTRLNSDGSEDTAFVGHTNDRTECVVVQPDGKILASGWFWAADDQVHGRIARFNSDGTLDADFQMDADYFVWCLALDAKGRVLCAGGFPHIGGAERKGVARFMDESAANGDPQPPIAPKPLELSAPQLSGGTLLLPVLSATNLTYTLEFQDGFGSNNWQMLNPVQGNGGTIYLHDDHPAATARFYRVSVR